MKAVIRLIQAVLTVVWLGLLAICLVLFRSTRSNGLPGIGQWRCYIVSGSAMAPELNEGDLAVIHTGEAPEAGDAVLCRDGSGRPEITRIIGTTDGQLILKPDGLQESRLAAESDIEGVYAGYLPGFGEPFRFLCSLLGAVTVFAAGLILIVLPGLLMPASKSPKREKPPRRPRRDGYTPRH